MNLSYSDLYDGFLYLDELRDGGSIDMYGAVPHVQRHLNIDRSTAAKIWVHWTNTYDGESDLDDRIDKALDKINDDEA